MTRRNRVLLCATVALTLGGCSQVSGVFEKKRPPPLSGDRISVLELQRTLEPDSKEMIGKGVVLPDSWKNDFWPQAGGYPGHVMQNLSLPGDGLRQVWTADIGAGSTGALPLTAQPVVAGNAVFTLDTSSTLSAFDAETGKKIWKADVMSETEDEAVIGGGIAFADGRLYVTNGFDEVLAMDAADGKILWRKRLSAPSRAAPTVLGNRVFVATLDNRLAAFDQETGDSLWDYAGMGETAGLLGAASPAADSNIVVPVFSSGEITALRAENGSVAWSDNLASVRNYGGGLEDLSDIKAMPVLDENLVIAISFGGKMAALDTVTGVRVWQREIGGAEMPWIAGENVFVLSSENQLIALNIANGAIVWVTELPGYENPEKKKNPVRWSGPVMANGRLFLAGSNGILMEVDALNGNVVRRIKTKRTVHIRPVIAKETLYLLDEGGTLAAYR